MATLATQELLRDSAIEELTLEAAAASDTFVNDGEISVLVVSMDASPITVTVTPGGNGIQGVGDGTLITSNVETLTLGSDQPSVGKIGKLNVGKFGTAPVIAASSPTNISLAAVKER